MSAWYGELVVVHGVIAIETEVLLWHGQRMSKESGIGGSCNDVLGWPRSNTPAQV